MTDLLTDRWEGVAADDLAARWGLPSVHLFARVSSTNDAARTLADGGAPHGTLVLAEEQTAGRGRSGRAWASPPAGNWKLMGIPIEPRAWACVFCMLMAPKGQ